MSTDIGTYTPLKQIVSYTIDELNLSIGEFDKMWILGLRALADMTFDVSGQTKTVRLPVSGNKTVLLPEDCLSWVKIGILDDKGQINTLKVNNALTTFRDTNPNRIGDLTPDISNSIGNQALVPYYSNFYYAGGSYNLFGVGNGVITYGECKVDEPNRVIILNTDFKYDSIMFEYLSCPQKDSEYQVMTCLQEAIISFIKWKMKMGGREEYMSDKINARRRLPKKKFILQSFQQVIRESNGFKLRS